MLTYPPCGDIPEALKILFFPHQDIIPVLRNTTDFDRGLPGTLFAAAVVLGGYIKNEKKINFKQDIDC